MDRTTILPTLRKFRPNRRFAGWLKRIWNHMLSPILAYSAIYCQKGSLTWLKQKAFQFLLWAVTINFIFSWCSDGHIVQETLDWEVPCRNEKALASLLFSFEWFVKSEEKVQLPCVCTSVLLWTLTKIYWTGESWGGEVKKNILTWPHYVCPHPNRTLTTIYWTGRSTGRGWHWSRNSR